MTKATRDIIGVADKGQEVQIVKEHGMTMGNDTDVVVKNRRGGMSIVALEDVQFDDVVQPEPETEEQRDENITQDDTNLTEEAPDASESDT